MIKKRPTFPTGHSLAGLPPIVKVLHSDERCELYRLDLTSPCDSILCLVRRPSGLRPDEQRLVKWWAAQPPEVLSVCQVFSPEDSPPCARVALLELRGRYLEGASFQDAKEGDLRRLFHSMLDLVDRGLPLQMYPDLDPSLIWLSSNESAMCTLLPLDGPLPAETEQVRLLASAFYRLATGIALQQPAGSVPPLIRWSKFGGEELSRVVGRCLAPVGQNTGISTLSALNDALGRARTGNLTLFDGTAVPSALLPSGRSHGLDKVAGMHALKGLLRREVVAPIRNPEPYRRYGLSIPNGILLYGPPGCGKTYIARQLAEELGHFFVEIIPSELASPYVHQSVMRIRELFDTAAEQAPAVLFIDEFEALVPPRGELGGHQQYKAEEVNEFLAHLNGCSDRKIFVIAATNQPEKIDPAVRRTGRLDKLIYVGPPDDEARKEMLMLYLEGRPVGADVDVDALAKTLEGYSASDIRFLVDEAARDALMKAQDITRESFRSAMAKVQPSVTPEIEAEYRSIGQRGI
jgi:DNA polymerase III delta prime subunit